jgi:hypothetical protein
MTEPIFLSYPARPVNGGHLHYALKKVGPWSYEPKYNGWRALLHVPTGAMWNRHGKRLSIACEFARVVHLLKLTPFTWLDVEALSRRHGLGKGSLIVLDCLDKPHLPYAERRTVLSAAIPTLPVATKPADKSDYLPPCYSDPLLVWDQLQEVNQTLGCDFYEGMVAKRDDSPYPIQLNASEQTYPQWMKHRFIK